ncbi:amino acid adenylation domain-containing protein [Micromonospora sp. FIMYZ51]|uniref:non-ribosomal peptide synthetase/type I polyketide synthase n=1 Tax=Micromonospora sp. FIMYZ51 TaxID=3051832 RepID=UPI00311EBA8C
MTSVPPVPEDNAADIAVVGLACRFPGADDVETFWTNLCAGVESIRNFDPAELAALGVPPEIVGAPNFVPAGAPIEGVDSFDHRFWGYSPREAALLDPQQRHFLETAWAAIEHAGYHPADHPGMIGVYAGMGLSTYLLYTLLNHPEVGESDAQLAMLGNDKDFLSSRVSYHLDLRGPSMAVQTGCSTSLVATHLACEALLSYQCDLALAGGSSMVMPERTGYLHVPGGTASSDGRCRAFDAAGDGTVFGSGAGVVVLKRLADALDDGDTVYAVIKGSAVNSDGANRVGFTAPSLEGQAEVVLRAQAVAGVDPATVSYIEAHGTGTKLGDPVEVAALTEVFRRDTERIGFCALGSVKTNIGHLDAAAGVAGLIKTVLALHHRRIPPSLNFSTPNPQIDFASSPFYVNTSLVDWPADGTPRRAGVSAFGFGGTNAHVVLEEAPGQPSSGPSDAPDRPQVLVLSAKSAAALDAMSNRLADHLGRHPELQLADVAHTLQSGRGRFDHRRALVCREPAAAVAALAGSAEGGAHDRVDSRQETPVAFLFAGLGDQYPGMGRELYRTEPVFRAAVDECCAVLDPLLGPDFRRELAVHPDVAPPARRTGLDLRAMVRGTGSHGGLHGTALAHSALFVVEYALAQLWRSLGVRPTAVLGHSLGEYVAATVAGVFGLVEALTVVVARARLFERTPPGAMLAVPLSRERTALHLDGSLSVALVNGPTLTVVSGLPEEIDRLAGRLTEQRISVRRLAAERAFHSPLVAGVAGPLAEIVAGVSLAAPQIPLVSNVTGTWMTAEQATDPAYWARHSVSTVRFADGLATLCADPDRALVEVGPGQSLSALAAEHLAAAGPDGQPVIVPSLPAAYDRRHPDEPAHLLDGAAKLWSAGVPVNFAGTSERGARRRVGLPTYPFERQRCRFEPAAASPVRASVPGRVNDPDAWLLAPSWRSVPMPPPAGPWCDAEHWLIFAPSGPGHGLTADLVERAVAAGHRVSLVEPAPAGARSGVERLPEGGYRIDPEDLAAYPALLAEVAGDGRPTRVLHMWSLRDPDAAAHPRSYGMHSLLWLARALAQPGDRPAVDLWVITSGLARIERADVPRAMASTLLGAAKCVPQEYEGIGVHCVDVTPEETAGPAAGVLAGRLLDVIAEPTAERLLAYRGSRRWVPTFEPLTLGSARDPLRPDAAYVITGGLGGIGLDLADHLTGQSVAVALVGRSGLPAEGEWDELLRRHGDADPTGRRIARVRAMRARGARVEVIQADVADPEQIEAAFAAVEQRLGPIAGVFHAAGVVGGPAFAPIDSVDAPWLDGVLRAKVEGTRALARALADRAPDFVLLFSSNAAVLGGLGTSAYTAGSVYLDTFAQAMADRPGPRWISVDLEDWIPEGGMARPTTSVTRYGIGVADGVRLLCRIAESADPGVVTIVTGDLEERLDRWIRHPEGARRAPSAAGGPRQPRPVLGTEYVEPSDDVERAIATIWADMLGLDRVGRDDDFYELGGHSLLATQIVSRARAALGGELSLLNLLQSPTVAGLAERVREGADGPSSSAAGPDPVPLVDRDGPIPLSYGQQRFWIIDQLAPGNPAYNIPDVVRIKGPLEPGPLRRSVDAVVARHEALRTSFGVDDEGRPVQRVAPSVSVAMPVTDLRHLPAAERRRRSEELALAEATRPFDLSRPPLLRTALLRVDEQEHLLLLTMHHSVSDAWSTGVLVAELGTHYARELGVSTEPPPALPVQYADYSAWQRAQLRGDKLDRLVAYWRAALAGAPPLVEFPPDRPRPTAQSFAGSAIPLTLPRSLLDELRQLGAEAGATLFMTLLTGFTYLLHRYSGESDVVVGSPIAGRTHPDVENLIGVFVNMLALRTQVEPDLSFRALLGRVRQTTLAAYAHQELPFELVVEAVAPERSLGHSQIFQNVLVLQNAPLPPLELAGLRLEQVPMPVVNAKFDLMVMLRETADGAVGMIEYSSDLFTAETVGRIGAHFTELLNRAVTEPDRPLGELDVLSAGERALVTGAWAHGPAGCTGPATLPELFRERALAGWDRTALRCAGDPSATLTFGQVEQRSNQLARELCRRGIGTESRVAVCVERSPDTVVLLLGILKAGAAYVPLDPGYPRQRLRFVVTDAAVDLAVVATEHRERLGPVPAPVVSLDELWRSCAERDPSPLGLRIDPTWPAYLLYTSGSTGTPKGVVGLHGGMVNRLTWMWREFPFRGPEVLCHKTSLSFLDSFWEIFGPLCHGVPLVVLPQRLVADVPALVSTLGEHRVTRLVLVPSLLRVILDTVPDLADVVPELDLWVSSGEPLTADLVAAFHAALPGRRLVNLYGASEISADVTWHLATPADADAGRVPLGRPIAGTCVYLLDGLLRPVPPGVPGELHVGGLPLGRGYVGRPDLTAERFVPDPFSDRPGDRLYRTGDLGRFRADGVLEYLGRADHQVKIRGFRVEPAEVERALCAHPAVSDAVVVADGEILVAHHVTDPDRAVDPEELREHLSHRLPPYMVPTVFVGCQRLPLTPSGKVDRLALARAERQPQARTIPLVAPRDDAERALADLWRETLGIDGPVGVHDNFWAVGGYSLLATRFVVLVRETFGAALPLERFFTAPTIAGVAAALRADPEAGPELDERAALVLQVAALSEEELDRLLAEPGGRQ